MNVMLEGVRLPLARFTLEIDATWSGRVTALFGASGSGKTSVLELIAGLRRPASGRIQIGGDIVTDVTQRVFAPPERRGVGYVPQEGALFPHLSVRQNLLYGHDRRKPGPAGLTFEHVTAVLEIDRMEDREVQTLSGGEQRRVTLARALLAGPRLLLLDEPLAGLDDPLRDRLLPYLKRARDEFAIPMIYVTHAPEEVIALCDDVLVLTDGRVEARGTPQALFAEGPPTYVRRTSDSSSRLK